MAKSPFVAALVLVAACRSSGIVATDGNHAISFTATQQYLGGAPTLVAALSASAGAPLRLVTSDYVARGVVLYDGHGDGTFTASAPLALGAGAPIAATAGRFLDRARQDVVVVTEQPATVSLVSTANPAGLETTWSLSTNVAFEVAAGDLDGDGLDDLIVPLYPPGGGAVLQVYFGRAGAAPALGPSLPVDLLPWSMRLGQLVGGPALDLAFWDGHYFGIAEGRGDGTFADARRLPTQVYMSSLALADFDGDGRTDLVAARPGASATPIAKPEDANVLTLLNAGDGSVRAPVGYADAGDTFFVDVADFDGDGRPDVLTQGYTINVLSGMGDGTLRTPPAYTVPGALFLGGSAGTANVAAGDFDGDGLPDLAVAGNGAVMIYRNTSR